MGWVTSDQDPDDEDCKWFFMSLARTQVTGPPTLEPGLRVGLGGERLVAGPLGARLEGTEEKFRNRESRPEDLQIIAELKDMVSERESLVKKLVDDKKFYQLELVNRETNFNKVFNASPNVGVINPLIKQKRKNEKTAASRFSSSPNLRALEAAGMGVAGTGSGQLPQPPPPPAQPSRLEPIPNSPLHHLELNSNKPLPPPTPPTEPKKFMR
ncbi:protein FAM184A-like [Scomber japonicus]|uniref:protein FAM184A-like n=1 Tax=Scomber japonicus TaxID=13676 RepID=UPI002305BB11|nr:protein FAM184A-like [Scomber japonicus]